MHSESGRLDRSKNLRYIAAALAAAIAMIHLVHPTLGGPRLVRHIQLGTLFDPRPLLFTLSAFAIFVGILLIYNGVFVRGVYVGGIALMVTYLLGYAAWHTVSGHGGFWPHLRSSGHLEMGVLETVWIHLVDDTVAMASKLLESILLVALVVLYRVETAP